MGCVQRSGKRTNPSGHEAYIHHITPKGERYLRNEINPEPAPTLSELQADVVDIAREVCSGCVPMEQLEQVVKTHDSAKLRRDPEWSPPQLLTDNSGELTADEIEQIKNDPVLDIEDFQ